MSDVLNKTPKRIKSSHIQSCHHDEVNINHILHITLLLPPSNKSIYLFYYFIHSLMILQASSPIYNKNIWFFDIVYVKNEFSFWLWWWKLLPKKKKKKCHHQLLNENCKMTKKGNSQHMREDIINVKQKRKLHE